MFKVSTYTRDKNGNRDKLIGNHFYKTFKEAQKAFNVMKKLSGHIHLVPKFVDTKTLKYGLAKSNQIGYIVEKPEDV